MSFIVTIERPDGKGSYQQQFASLEEAIGETRKLQEAEHIGDEFVCVFAGSEQGVFYSYCKGGSC